MSDHILYSKDKAGIGSDSHVVEVSELPNPVLKRLIDEVRYEKKNKIGVYNRVHNRHNRGR